VAAITAHEIITLLDLKPLPIEGGYYAETYRSKQSLPAEFGAAPSASPRPLSTAIYYLLTPETFSAIHRLPGPEIYHFYLGDPVDLTMIHPDGSVDAVALGTDLGQGMRPQVVVPGGCWQGSRLREGGSFALLGTTMSPGYHPDDFELGDRRELESIYPRATGLIRKLTR
jgi:predicted cupin superfamily sugar epimerase